MQLRNLRILWLPTAAVVGFSVVPDAGAWDYDAHRVINQIALASLPTNFPPFVFTPGARERIAFLAGEPDRWRNTPDLPLRHFNHPDHYLDLEELERVGLGPNHLRGFRYELVAHLALARATNPGAFPAIDPAKNTDETRQLIGFLPWAITEHFSKLKSQFSYLRVFGEGGTTDEILNAQQNIIHTMGIMGHFVGDGAQPLHLTRHHHGWVGPNPRGYTTNSGFHAWIDGGFFQKTGLVPLAEVRARIRPAQLVTWRGAPAPPERNFEAVIEYLLRHHERVEPLYQLEKAGQLAAEGEASREGRAFLVNQLLEAGQMLGDLWFTAWQQVHEDPYLKGQLKRRQAGTLPR